ncbi:LamG-like jellyroll fold domain-containing protein [Streptomyces erythrochromogenes]|uniref:LamG-like jellyroll fold domain-containing protein n=1 Tax=Streptomyces erythrochromogenes TaxID=285574 RepID=UPI00332DDB14
MKRTRSSTSRLVAAAACTAAVATGLVAAPAAQASGTAPSTPDVTRKEQILFRSGTAGYGCFRIPTMVRTGQGTLLAFAEARTSPSCADRGPMDIVVRRSTNDGRTWGPIKVALSGSDTDPEAPYTRGNPAPVVDKINNRVFLLSTGESTVPGDKRMPYVQESADDGLTFGAPTRLQRMSASHDATSWFGTGPSHGIQLKNPKYAGRLVVGAYENSTSTKQLAGVYYSDDFGKTWKVSEEDNALVANKIKPTEPSVVELLNGDVYIGARNERPGTEPHRTRALSKDGGATLFNETAPDGTTRLPPHQPVPSLVTPQIQASLLALEKTYQQTSGDTLIAAAPSHPEAGKREQMKIRYSLDGGERWTDAPNGLINADRMQAPEKYPDRAGYSDLAELADGEIGMVYEGGATFSAAHIYFKRFHPADLGIPGQARGGPRNTQQAPLPGRTTPDNTPQANDAHLTGNTTLEPGRFRQALTLTGPGSYADIPYAPAIDPGAADATYSFHFKHRQDAANAPRVLMWGYGQGAATPQVWIRAYPKDNKIVARVEGTNGQAVTATVDAPAAFADDEWHFLSLVREGNAVRLTVDDAHGTTTGTLSGPLSTGHQGIRLGAKPNDTAQDPLTGSLDDFRIHGKALDTDELGRVRTGAAAAATTTDALRIHLPFQVVDTAEDPGSPTPVAIADDVSGNGADATVLLTPGKKPVTVTPDAEHPAAARMGKYALQVDADHQGLDVPHTPAVDTDDKDFTHTLWFRHSATAATPRSVLLWAYGVGTEQAPQPSLWVRSDPKNNRLVALAETATSKVEVEVKDTLAGRTAFGDDTWHLLTVTRAGGALRVTVDADHRAEKPGLTGSFTAGRPASLGLRLGSRPTGNEIFTGFLDDYRLYKRALTDDPAAPNDELDKIRAAGSGTGSYPAGATVWWNMEHGTVQVHDMYNRPQNGPATPDRTVHGNNAYVRGTPGITGTGGRFGGALDLDGDDSVELPFTDSEALGSADFTLATWVRFDPAAIPLPAPGSQQADPTPVIAWAYGVGATERQLWLRADPRAGRLVGLIQTENATTVASIPDSPFRTAKDRFHHVVLKREAGKLTLSIDGSRENAVDGTEPLSCPPAPGTCRPGSLTHGDAFKVTGFHLGTRPDGYGPSRFKGSLDEFTLVRRALSDTETTALRDGNTVPATDRATVAHLSFEKITTTGYARM